MEANKYNGWTNYPTWRINLEMFDAWDIRDLCGYTHQETMEVEAYEAGQCLREYAEELITEDAPEDSFALSYALAFLSDVNWTEIASAMLETYKIEHKDEQETN
jgi:hypothetical protein